MSTFEEIKQFIDQAIDWASQLSMKSITGMLLHHVDFCDIWLKQNTP